MAFWLASKRDGQATDFIQRFDPRFWTVDFPRPMMASVVTTAPDALRIDLEFHRKSDLAGLIWASEDTFDHPLLAYDTDRDYSRTTLSFRWRSSGVIALDGVDGPTLTIEGRDETGAARSGCGTTPPACPTTRRSSCRSRRWPADGRRPTPCIRLTSTGCSSRSRRQDISRATKLCCRLASTPGSS